MTPLSLLSPPFYKHKEKFSLSLSLSPVIRHCSCSEKLHPRQQQQHKRSEVKGNTTPSCEKIKVKAEFFQHQQQFLSESMEPQIQQEPLKKCGGGRGRSASGCFDCSICLDFAVDPVVTLCGHLYCWPCIYKWLTVETISPQQCPVCKAALSQDSLVPLYGRGGHSSSSSKHSYHHTLLDIPQRPNSCIHNREDHTEVVEPRSPLTTNDEDPYIPSNPVHEHTWGDYNLTAPPSPSSRVIHSTAGGVLGEMASVVLPWVLRDHHRVAEAASLQFSSSPYYVAGSPRLRRQEMEVQSSLRQIWLFLFCCAMLCLLLF